jgi:pyruvate dehydrogenase E1 component
MVAEQEDVFYYLTLMNENYPHPAMPEGAEEGILRGIHRIAGDGSGAVQLLGSGTILREVEAAARLLQDDWGIEADVYSVTSFTELAREGMEAERWSMLHPGEDARVPYAAQVLSDKPAVTATDYMRAFGEQIRPYVPGAYSVLGTDGFGRSDWRRSLREFFEVDRRYVTLAALRSVAPEKAVEAISKYEIKTDGEAPWRR